MDSVINSVRNSDTSIRDRIRNTNDKAGPTVKK